MINYSDSQAWREGLNLPGQDDGDDEPVDGDSLAKDDADQVLGLDSNQEYQLYIITFGIGLGS